MSPTPNTGIPFSTIDPEEVSWLMTDVSNLARRVDPSSLAGTLRTAQRGVSLEILPTAFERDLFVQATQALSPYGPLPPGSPRSRGPLG